MLTQKAVDIIKSTAPIIEIHGEALARNFYERLFTYNPEMISFFNSSNQINGTQQKALANAICAYAANIDNLDVLQSSVERIANKHTSLQIKPEHYHIIGENLLASISDVLGESAKENILNAWKEAYDFLAKILIKREEQIYNENQKKSGGWRGFKSFTISRKEKESDIITSFYLLANDGNPLPDFSPGQYITIRITAPDGQKTMRNYSLSDKPNQHWLRISVKKEINRDNNTIGYVSHMLHENIDIGSKLEVAPPCGDFFLNTKLNSVRPLVLLAGGVGITPILSMLKSVLDSTSKRDVTLIYGCLNEKVQAFKKTINQMVDKHSNLKVYYRYSENCDFDKKEKSSTGYVDSDFMYSSIKNQNSDYYICGPKPFMINVYHTLMFWDIDYSQIHIEFFGPRSELKNFIKPFS